MKMRLLILGFILGSFLPQVGMADSAAARDLLERAFADDRFSGPRMSPDGKRILMMRRSGDRQEIHVMYTDPSIDRGYRLTTQPDISILSAVWADNDNFVTVEGAWGTTVAEPAFVVRSYSFGRNIRENRRGGFNNNPATRRTIIPTIVSGLPAVPGKILVGVPSGSFRMDPRRRRADLGGNPIDVFLHDIRNGESVLIAANPSGFADDFITDSTGQVRVASEFVREKRVFYRTNNDAEWSVIASDERFVPIGFLPGDELLLVGTRHERDTTALRVFNSETREFVTNPIGNPRFDMAGEGIGARTLRDPSTGSILGQLYQREKPTILWLDASLRRLQERLDGRIPGMTNLIVGLAADEKHLFVQSTSDINPGLLLRWNLETDEVTGIHQFLPGVSSEELLPTRPISFKARDGEEVFGYLTLPRNADTRKPLPFITVVHGGPMVRDYWGNFLNLAEAQFFAAMGMAVMQVNYRGSAGYGKAFRGEGHEWSARGAVLDVADGTRWAIEEGIADPARTVIYGASFGGYAAMASAAHEPDLYTIAIAAMGVYDWAEMRRQDEEDMHPIIWELLREEYGEIGESELYTTWNPASRARDIRIPVLLMHGEYDQRVDIRQFTIMRSALRSAGVNHETFRYTLGGHGFGDQRGWVSYYSRIQRFIEQHIDLR